MVVGFVVFEGIFLGLLGLGALRVWDFGFGCFWFGV